jgi:phosphomannomutase
MKTPHPSLFREYDIRGIVGETLHPQDATFIGKSYGSIVVATYGTGAKVAVGRDGRMSSPIMHKALCEGLLSVGCNVVDIGIGPTPMVYFTVWKRDLQGGVMVTGSHNPPTHNGFKFMLGKDSLYGAGIKELESSNVWVAGGKGTLETLNIFQAYVGALAAALTGKKPLKAAWDAGNGAAGEVMAALVKLLPGQHICLNEEIDGTFPNHHPDPTVPKNLEQLIATVKKEKCDVGIAFDGDADRIGVVDGQGRILWGDQLMQLFAADVLKDNPGSTIIADVKASQNLFDEIARLGGKPMMWKTGHSLVKAKMKETKAPLAGEMSGHIFFADKNFGYDDGIYAAVRLLNILAYSDKSLSELFDEMPKAYNTPEIRIECTEERKFKIVDEIKAKLWAEKADFNDTDGVRVNTPEGWWLLRASNTQAVLVARAEAKKEADLPALVEKIKSTLAACGLAFKEGGH